MLGAFCQPIPCCSSVRGVSVHAYVRAFTTSFSFLLSRSGTAPTFGGFCSFSGFVTHAGSQQRETAVLGMEDMAEQAGASRSAAGCAGSVSEIFAS